MRLGNYLQGNPRVKSSQNFTEDFCNLLLPDGNTSCGEMGYRSDLDSVWSRYFLDDSATAEMRRLLNLTFCVMRGIALQTVLRDDDAFYDAMMSDWKEIMKRMRED